MSLTNMLDENSLKGDYFEKKIIILMPECFEITKAQKNDIQKIHDSVEEFLNTEDFRKIRENKPQYSKEAEEIEENYKKLAAEVLNEKNIKGEKKSLLEEYCFLQDYIGKTARFIQHLKTDKINLSHASAQILGKINIKLPESFEIKEEKKRKISEIFTYVDKLKANEEADPFLIAQDSSHLRRYNNLDQLQLIIKRPSHYAHELVKSKSLHDEYELFIEYIKLSNEFLESLRIAILEKRAKEKVSCKIDLVIAEKKEFSTEQKPIKEKKISSDRSLQNQKEFTLFSEKVSHFKILPASTSMSKEQKLIQNLLKGILNFFTKKVLPPLSCWISALQKELSVNPWIKMRQTKITLFFSNSTKRTQNLKLAPHCSHALCKPVEEPHYSAATCNRSCFFT